MALLAAGLLFNPFAAEAIDRKEILEQMKKSRPKDLQVLSLIHI
mgnify:CR=1 FL=1